MLWPTVSSLLLNDLKSLIASPQKVLVIVGSGVSIGATQGASQAAVASWGGLLKDGVRRCRDLNAGTLTEEWERSRLSDIQSGDLDSMIATAEQISRKLGAPSNGEYRAWLRETVGSLRAQKREVLEALRDLRVPLATTNYDGLLTEVTGLPPVTWRNRSKVSRILRGDDQGILHLHGHWEEPESVVLGIRSYDQVRDDPHAGAVRHALGLVRSLVFVGCGDGLQDPNFGPFLTWLGKVSAESDARHYRLAVNGFVGKLQAGHPQEQRIRVLGFGEGHGDLAGFLRSLAPTAVTSLSPVESPEPLPEPGSAVAPAGQLSPASGNIGREVSAKVFISYRHTEPDQKVAGDLARALREAGADVFWDSDLRVGQRWAEEIERNLRASSFFVVLISEESMRSDMVGREVRLAHDLSRSASGALTLLPVRVRYTGALPYDLAACLDPVQYTVWSGEGDSVRVIADIMAAVSGGHALPVVPAKSDVGIRRLHEATEGRGAPLPKAEIRFETGSVRLDSPFYIERRDDATVLGHVREPGGVTLIVKGVRQMGKSSLLARAMAAARKTGGKVLHLDFQLLEEGQLKDLKTLLRWMGRRMESVLRPPIPLKDVWMEEDGAKENLSNYLEQAVLASAGGPVFLLLDEVDRVFEHSSYRGDFFSMVRHWHNQRATYPDPWDRLNLVIAHSTEPSLWIEDIHQSPFNVGERFRLDDFSPIEAAELNRRYGSPLTTADETALRHLVGGHPFLLRQALYSLVHQPRDFNEFRRLALESDGPFGDHLKRYVFGLGRDARLRDALKAVLRTGVCQDEAHFQRLSATGLISGSDRARCAPRCQLYADYFRIHL